MRYLALVLLLAACSSTTTVVAGSPQPSSNDARICELALTPPWQSGAIEALTRDATTPIEIKAAEVNEKFGTDVGGDDPVGAWNELRGMCIDAGY